MPKYALVEEAAKYCWSHNFLDVFRDFFSRNADIFADAPQVICEEQNMEYYTLFQEYLKLYESQLQDYIESMDVSIEDFYRELEDVMSDPNIKDKKLLHFTNYLVACTDYASFYKVMVRAAKKERRAEEKTGGTSDSGDAKGGSESKSESKPTSGESKSDYK